MRFQNIYLALCLFLGTGPFSQVQADVRLSSLFSEHSVLQRNKLLPVWGTAGSGEKVSIDFNGQSQSTIADARGDWNISLSPMTAKSLPQTMIVSGNNTLIIKDMLIGDVWLCSGQSNMAFSLGGTDRMADIASADFSGIRQFSVPLVTAGNPLQSLTAQWSVCSPSTATGFSAVAFYFARKVHQANNGAIPVGIIVSSVGGTRIEPWLAPEGVTDIPSLKQLFTQAILPFGPFALFNGMIHPLAPFALKGILWYQGENSESTVQSADSYFLKMKALACGWSKVFQSENLPFYFVQIANWGKVPLSANPDLSFDGWSADTRIQQANAMALPHAGMASAIDIGESGDMHPKDKLDLGERLALWTLKNEFGQSSLVTSGPILKEVTVSGSKAICSFDHVGSGLMIGAKIPYQPTTEVANGKLNLFSIAGMDGKWFSAIATIEGNTVTLTSTSVPLPQKISYASWQNPLGCNLYNREGLPASPFHVEDISIKYMLSTSASIGGNINPAGIRFVLPRSTSSYTFSPNPGFFIQEIKVDGVSMGSPSTYTVDPVYADHAIQASFGTTAPSYTIRVPSSGGGTVLPSGDVSLVQGETRTFQIIPEPGCQVMLKIDGCPIGPRRSYTFSDIRNNHTLVASFTCPIVALSGFGGVQSPTGTIDAEYGSSPSFLISPLPGYVLANLQLDGVYIAPVLKYTFSPINKGHTLVASFTSIIGKGGTIPKPNDLLFAGLASSLPDSGLIRTWPMTPPLGKSMQPLGNPKSMQIDGKKIAVNEYAGKQGHRQGTYSSPIPCTGASIVVVAKPIRNGASSGWTSIVDVFYDRLVLGIKNENGLVCVRRNGSLEQSATSIPDGQTTLLSLIVQPDGAYQVWANGQSILTRAASVPSEAVTALTPSTNFNTINIGRGSDDWSVFNGFIGDIFFYKTALTDLERLSLEGYLAEKLVGGNVVALAAKPLTPAEDSRTEAAISIQFSPTSLSLDFPNLGKRTTYLSNQTGRQLVSHPSLGLRTEIKLKELGKGTYLLRVVEVRAGRTFSQIRSLHL
jgi:sialate O-acetylesterase